MKLVAVAVPVPFLDLLTYSVPSTMAAPPRGARVVVPLGKRSVTGIVVETDAAGVGDDVSVKDVLEVLDDCPFLPRVVVDLALWVAEYYACGAGDALTAALPPDAPQKTLRVATLTAQGHDESVTGVSGSAVLGRRQREAIDVLRGSPTGLSVPALDDKGISGEVLQRLAAKGLVSFRRERVDRDPFATSPAGQVSRAALERTLTDDQAAALKVLADAASTREFAALVLQGVTGSGKTEVYLRLAEVIRKSGRSVLVLVPEIALTPAVASAFRDTFGDRVAIQHSGLSLGERVDQWTRIRSGKVDIVVGTRSAVFAPLENLGLIIVDEEHDGSFKQDETPRYNGRDVAVMRARSEKAVIVLGSATPSLETSQNAEAGRYSRVFMDRRVENRPLATVSVVDMRAEYAADGPDVILSRALKAAIEARLTSSQQSLILLNRRGLSTAVFCRQCGQTLECPNCSVSLIIHTEGKERRHRARCHYCNYSTLVPKSCPSCAGPYLERRGFGTEKVADEIATLWPAARIARLDRDAVRRKGTAAAILRSMAAGRIDVLVGTQMIAKGHDFPGVTLVGVISADVGLGLADFRAGERTFQLLTQVAGRAGRGTEPGEAIVQTLYPSHYSIRHACRQDYRGFFADELVYRRSMNYPPLTALVNLIVRGRDAGSALGDAAALARELRKSALSGNFVVLGPAPAPVAKLRGEHRAQIFLKGRNRTSMRRAVLTALEGAPDLRRRVAVDIDPMSIL